MEHEHSVTARACQTCNKENLVFFLPGDVNTFEITCPECEKTTQEAFYASKIFKIVSQRQYAPPSVDYKDPLLPMRSKTE
jgi:hypothetical protein